MFLFTYAARVIATYAGLRTANATLTLCKSGKLESFQASKLVFVQLCSYAAAAVTGATYASVRICTAIHSQNERHYGPCHMLVHVWPSTVG
jgi:hypothetical protein